MYKQLMAVAIVTFALGAVLGFGVGMRQGIKTAHTTVPKTIDVVAHPNDMTAKTSSLNAVQTHQATQDKKEQTLFSTHQLTEQSAKAILNGLPDAELNRYIVRFMSASDAALITDKRQFANRAIEELYQHNSNQPLVGQVRLAASAEFPEASLNVQTLQKNQTLYAHFDTFGKVPLGANVFVKWTNRHTGEVLLFEKKPIVADKNQNWVSYRPYAGWQVGAYDIRFYEFNSTLTPVAQLSYDVFAVVD